MGLVGVVVGVGLARHGREKNCGVLIRRVKLQLDEVIDEDLKLYYISDD